MCCQGLSRTTKANGGGHLCGCGGAASAVGLGLLSADSVAVGPGLGNQIERGRGEANAVGSRNVNKAPVVLTKRPLSPRTDLGW